VVLWHSRTLTVSASEPQSDLRRNCHAIGGPQMALQFLRRFLQHGVGRVIGWVGAPIFFHSQPDQNCQHNEANDPFFLSCENEHQLRCGFT